jgi:hypothetical protein
MRSLWQEFWIRRVMRPIRGDRLSLNQGRDMVKADYVHGPHAFTVAWSSAALAPANVDLHDTTAFRYNVLVHGFDTSLIAGHDRGSDSFGGLTFTRVVGQAWEIHGEGMWREQAAALLGAKYITRSGVTLIGEYETQLNTGYYRDMSLSPLAGRQHYAFFNVGKSRLRERPGWKEWGRLGLGGCESQRSQFGVRGRRESLVRESFFVVCTP